MNNTLDLLHHMHWADAKVWDTVLNASEANDDERLRKLLFHIHMVQRAFLRVWSNAALELPKIEDFPSLAAIGSWGKAYHAMLTDYLGAVGMEEKDRIVVVPWARYMEQRFGKKPADVTLNETMLQVAMHSSYHRGQVNARLRELGCEPPIVDYIAWVWLARPDPEWPDMTKGIA